MPYGAWGQSVYSGPVRDIVLGGSVLECVEWGEVFNFTNQHGQLSTARLPEHRMRKNS